MKVFLTLLTVLATQLTFANERSVKLISAKIIQGCSSCARIAADILVKNLDYDKVVTLHYQTDLDPHWHSIQASFAPEKQTEDSSTEVWSFNTGSDSNLLTGKTRFYIEYKVSGQKYYDNNCGWNYQISLSEPAEGHICQ